MKLRVNPEDFVVEEINSNFNIVKQGDYSLYLLEKKSIDTLEIINILCKKYNLMKNDIGFAGIKDKHAITTQYITIPKNKNVKDYKSKDFSLTYLGNVLNPIKVGDLDNNKFTITIKDLNIKQLKLGKENISKLEERGVINYYDSQRFGSTKKGVFIAKFLIKEEYEMAIKYFIISQATKYEDIKKQEKLIMNWNNFGNLKIDMPYLDFLQTEYLKNRSFKALFKKIPNKLRELIVMSYQSYLWNECLKEIIKENGRYDVVKYNIGELYFPNYKLEIKSFPLIGRKLEENDFENKIISKVLKIEELKLEDIKKISKSGSFLKSEHRNALIYPKQVEIIDEGEDKEYSTKNDKKYFMKITFILPKGSYATTIIKEIYRD